MAVVSLWSGGVDAANVTVVARLNAAAASCRVAVSTASDLSAATYSGAAAPDANNYVKASVAGLVADTAYYYGIEVDGVLDAATGQFRTAPVAGTHKTFSLGVIACSNTGNAVTYDRIRERGLAFLTHMGDLFYADIDTNDESLYRTAYQNKLAQSRMNALWKAQSVDYVWDDHDFGADNSDGTGAGRPAASAVYRQAVPHYTLPAGAGDNPIYHAFTWGRARFIVTDLRHQRSPRTDADTAAKTQMGATQKAWFKAELLTAKADSTIDLIVWVSSQVWIGEVGGDFTTTDTWAEYDTERDELVAFILGNGLAGRICILAGDAHLVAIDNGSNSPGGIPVLQSAPIWGTSSGEGKGGPYSEGRFYDSVTFHQYSVMTVTDDGTNPLTVTWTGYRVDEATGIETQLVTFSFRPAIWRRRPLYRRGASSWQRVPLNHRGASSWKRRPVQVNEQ